MAYDAGMDSETPLPRCPEPPPEAPVPFEDRDAIPGFWMRLGATFRLAFQDPMAFYARIPRTDSLIAPWRLLLLFSLPLYFFLMIYAFFGSVMAVAAAFSPKTEDRLIGMAVGGCLVGLILLMPFLQLLGILVTGTVNHLFLWIWGGLRNSPHGLRQTLRATAYTQAFVGLLSLIPLLGIFAILGGWILLGIGLARMHRTETWRGVWAMLTPMILLGSMLVLGIGTVIGLAIREEHGRTSEPAQQRTIPAQDEPQSDQK